MMRTRRMFIVALAALCVCIGPAAGGEDVSWNLLTIDLRDSSRIVGVARVRSLTIRGALIGEMEVPFQRIKRIQPGATPEATKTSFHNGDFVHGAVDLTELRIESALGPVAVAMRDVTQVVCIPLVEKFSFAAEETQARKAKLTVEVDDGSRIVGEPVPERISVIVESLGTLAVPFDQIRTITFSDDHKTAKLACQGGNVLCGTINLEALEMKTLFGKVTIPTQHMLSATNAHAADFVAILGPHNGHWYAVIEEKLDWEKARARAEGLTWLGMKGHLATVTSREENDWIVNAAGVDSSTEYWLGGAQPPDSPEPNGDWRWITGEPWVFTNWAAGEPNDSGGEDHLTFWPRSGGQWNDLPQSKACAFMVEFESRIPAQPEDLTPSGSVQ